MNATNDVATITYGGDVSIELSLTVTTGAHDATVAFVASGRADGGVLNASVWDKLVESANPNAAKVRVLATTAPYYDYNWTVRPGLDAALTIKLTQAFLKLDPANPEHKEIMGLQRASKFIATQAANYDSIESAARSAVSRSTTFRNCSCSRAMLSKSSS